MLRTVQSARPVKKVATFLFRFLSSAEVASSRKKTSLLSRTETRSAALCLSPPDKSEAPFSSVSGLNSEIQQFFDRFIAEIQRTIGLEPGHKREPIRDFIIPDTDVLIDERNLPADVPHAVLVEREPVKKHMTALRQDKSKGESEK